MNEERSIAGIELLEGLGEICPVAVALVSGNGLVQWISPAAKALLGEGASAPERLLPESGRLTDLLDAASPSRARVRLSDGESRGIRMTSTPVGSDSYLIRMAAETATPAAVRCQRFQVIGRLAGGVAHGLNGLLGVISGLADAVSRDLPAGSQSQEDLQDILTAVTRASRMTRMLLLLVPDKPSEQRPMNLLAVTRELIPMVCRAYRHGIEIDLESKGAEPWIVIDRSSLQQLLLNLCFAAADAMAGKGRLLVSTATRGNKVELRVGDAGCGGKAGVWEGRSPCGDTEPAGALCACREIVREAGGEISVESKNGKRALFVVHFPGRNPCSQSGTGRSRLPCG